MKESDLYPAVRDWLKARGYTIRLEIFDADVVATKDDQVIVIELKPGITHQLMTQMHNRAQWADEVWAAVGVDCDGRSDGFRYHGFGLLSVAGGKVRQRVKAKPQPWHRHKMRAYRMKRLARLPEAMDHHLAGLPACRALKEQRREVQPMPVTPPAAARDADGRATGGVSGDAPQKGQSGDVLSDPR